MEDYKNQQWWIELQQSLDGFDDSKISDGKLKQLNAAKLGGITSGRKNATNGNLSKAGKVSATKQWKENRESSLIKSKKGGESARDNKKGCHSLSKKELVNAGKKGYSNGLAKLSKDRKIEILKKASMASREVNSKITKEDVIFMRKNFIPRHTEFGVVAFSKKYNTTECAIRNAIKGRTFKDVI
jgi:hypothetical protein